MVPVSRRELLLSSLCVLAGCASTAEPTETEEPRPATFYIENVTAERHTVSLRIASGEDQFLAERYALPSFTRVNIPETVPVDRDPTVRYRVDDGSETTATWDVHSCANSEAPAGNTDGGLRITVDGSEFQQNICDVVVFGTQEYEDASEYRTEEG